MLFLSVSCFPSFYLQLPKDQCTESFEKSILRLLNQGVQSESRDLEKNLRYFIFSPNTQIMGILQEKCHNYLQILINIQYSYCDKAIAFENYSQNEKKKT